MVYSPECLGIGVLRKSVRPRSSTYRRSELTLAVCEYYLDFPKVPIRRGLPYGDSWLSELRKCASCASINYWVSRELGFRLQRLSACGQGVFHARSRSPLGATITPLSQMKFSRGFASMAFGSLAARRQWTSYTLPLMIKAM